MIENVNIKNNTISLSFELMKNKLTKEEVKNMPGYLFTSKNLKGYIYVSEYDESYISAKVNSLKSTYNMYNVNCTDITKSENGVNCFAGPCILSRQRIGHGIGIPDNEEFTAILWDKDMCVIFDISFNWPYLSNALITPTFFFKNKVVDFLEIAETEWKINEYF